MTVVRRGWFIPLLTLGALALGSACGGQPGGGGDGGSGGGGGGAGGGGGGNGGPTCAQLTCDPLATCDTSLGMPRCQCPSGYEGDGSQCADIDECTNGTATCAPGATCTNTPGAYTCACGEGFTGDGQTCTRGASWLAVSTGAEFTCGILAGGSLWCWGRADDGRLGAAGGSDQLVPARVGTATDWESVSAGYAHGCGIRANGALYCWGSNLYGAVGVPSATTGPNQVGTDTNWERVSAGTDHTCATRTDHTAWCWGLNSEGQLGAGTPYGTTSKVPLQVGSDSNWKIVSAGELQSCGVRMDGTLWCWGMNSSGQLGIGSGTFHSNVPVQVGTDTSWSTISAGGNHSCAIRTDGSLFCWGANGEGQLCAGSGVIGNQSTPVQVGTATSWAEVSAGDGHTCARQTNGSIWCCGSNASYELGDETNVKRRDPVQVGTATDWTAVRAGASHSCGMRSDGTLWCWGGNLSGQVGDDTTTDRGVPTQVH